MYLRSGAAGRGGGSGDEHVRRRGSETVARRTRKKTEKDALLNESAVARRRPVVPQRAVEIGEPLHEVYPLSLQPPRRLHDVRPSASPERLEKVGVLTRQHPAFRNKGVPAAAAAGGRKGGEWVSPGGGVERMGEGGVAQ